MKKLIIIVLTVFMIAGCSTSNSSGNADKNREKIDVSALSIPEFNAEKADMTNYTLLTDTKHVFKKITMEDSIRFFTEKGSGVVYYGYEGCPFCQQAVPVLNNAARQMGVDIYYVDVLSTDGNNEQVTNDLIDHIKDVLVEEDGEPVFYVPQVFVIKNGEIVGDHLSLVDSYDSSKDMNESQRTELRTIYLDMIEELH